MTQFLTPIFTCPQSWDQAIEKCQGRRKWGSRGGAWPLQFLKDQLTLNQLRGKIMSSTLQLAPFTFSNLPTLFFALSWVNILTLGTEFFMFGRKGWNGHALLVEPSKSHCGIAKIFAQVNSLQKIIVKNAIRTQKEFFAHCSYVYTTRDLRSEI